MNSSKLNTNIDVKTLENVECSNCKCIYWMEATILKKVSPLLTENGKGGFMPIVTWACVKCGNVNDELNPLKVIVQ